MSEVQWSGVPVCPEHGFSLEIYSGDRDLKCPGQREYQHDPPFGYTEPEIRPHWVKIEDSGMVRREVVPCPTCGQLTDA